MKKKHSIHVYASTDPQQVQLAVEKYIADLKSHISHIHSTEADWMHVLSERLSSGSLWDEHCTMVLHLKEKDIKTLSNDWFKHFIATEHTTHHVVIALTDSFAKEHTLFKHPNIAVHDIYDRITSLTPEEKNFVGNDPEAIYSLGLLKKNTPTFRRWHSEHGALDIPMRIASLKALQPKETNTIFLLWIHTLLGKKPVSALDTLDSKERMECYYYVSAWVRGSLLEEEQQKTSATGLNKWPDALNAMRQWRLNTTRNIRYTWYVQWLTQEHTLKGLRYPRNPHQGWQECKILHRQWVAHILSA